MRTAGSEGTLFFATEIETEAAVAGVIADWKSAGFGYAAPVLWNEEGNKVWELRCAGQWLMSNVGGDAKPREVVEDTAVGARDLPTYIDEDVGDLGDGGTNHCEGGDELFVVGLGGDVCADDEQGGDFDGGLEVVALLVAAALIGMCKAPGAAG